MLEFTTKSSYELKNKGTVHVVDFAEPMPRIQFYKLLLDKDVVLDGKVVRVKAIEANAVGPQVLLGGCGLVV